MDLDKRMEKNTPSLIQESKDNCKKTHYLKKLLKIRTKVRNENS